METPDTQHTADNVIVLRFADAKVPEFKEVNSREYILYGEDNTYPDYLTYLFNKSAKHNAIISGKAFYVFGNGFPNGDFTINRLGESLNDISRKCALDVELYGGYRLEVVYNGYGIITEVYHVDYSTLRLTKGGGYLYSEQWKRYTKEYQTEFIPAFDPTNPTGTQIYAYNEYRPNTKHYPLPGYIGSNNYIETDIEISKYYLSAIRNGMTPSKLIQFFDGEPTDEKKDLIERRMTKKFAGSENAGKIVMVFSKSKDKSVEISDLSSTDLDKLFTEMNKTVQQEIFSGHLVTSPMLFGIKTEGQLGGNTELQVAYSLFQNTYAKPKATAISKEMTYLLSFSSFRQQYTLVPTDPVGVHIDVNSVIDMIPRAFILRTLGIPDDDIKNDPAAPPNASNAQPGATTTQSTQTAVNDNIKNLTGRQQQQLERIIRRYQKGALTEAQAKTLLKSGLGLNDAEINELLGIKAVVTASKFSGLNIDDDLDYIISVFDSYGESKKNFEIVRQRKVFSTDVADLEDFETTVHEAFRTKPGQVTPAQIMVKYSYEGPEDSRNRPFCAKLLSLDRLYSRADIEKLSAKLGYSVFDRRGGWWRHKDGTTTPYCRHNWKANIVMKKDVKEKEDLLSGDNLEGVKEFAAIYEERTVKIKDYKLIKDPDMADQVDELITKIQTKFTYDKPITQKEHALLNYMKTHKNYPLYRVDNRFTVESTKMGDVIDFTDHIYHSSRSFTYTQDYKRSADVMTICFDNPWSLRLGYNDVEQAEIITGMFKITSIKDGIVHVKGL